MKRRLFVLAVILSIALVIIISLFMFRQYYRSQVFLAIKNNDMDMLKRAVLWGADINKTRYPETANWGGIFDENPTPLMWACKLGNEEIALYLLECGADVNRKDPWTQATALQKALAGTKRNRFSLAKCLVEHGADIQTYAGTYSPIARSLTILDSDYRETIAQGFELFKYLLLNGASRQMPNGKSNMLTYASCSGNIQAVEYLLDQGYYNINDQDAEGRTALIEAAAGGHKALYDMLVERGADLSIKDNDGKTAIDYV